MPGLYIRKPYNDFNVVQKKKKKKNEWYIYLNWSINRDLLLNSSRIRADLFRF